MSDTNFVPTSTASPSAETYYPDGHQVVAGPETEHKQFQYMPWEVSGFVQVPNFKQLPVIPQHQIPESVAHAPAQKFENFVPVDTHPKLPKFAQLGDSFLQSLLTTQIYQNPVLRERSKIE